MSKSYSSVLRNYQSTTFNNGNHEKVNKNHIKMERPKEWDINEETPPYQETVNTLIETLIKPERLKQDLLFSLFLVLMKENDFRLIKNRNEVNIVDYIVAIENKTHEAIFLLNGYDNVTIKLLMTPIKDIVLINVTLLEVCSETYSICVAINRYFADHDSVFKIPTNFANVEELSILFKERIIAPIKNSILNYNCIPGGALCGLPIDILYLILLRLPVKDVLSLSETCKRINGIINEDCLWAHLYGRDFPDRRKIDGKGWKDTYKEIYLLKSREERERVVMESPERTDSAIPRSFTPDSRWEVIL